ncbi:MAG: GNAT family N-acetyltransferase [Chloroflexi bacterium]|nr:GNAT family N-acetyltransferase [Chloroflexota bacterium]
MITSSKITIREKRLTDAQNDYQWEKDPELAYLDAAPVTTTSFSRYLLDYTEELHNPFFNCQRFAIDTLDGEHIGNCSYYNINQSRGDAELGIMIGNRDYWDKGYGVAVVSALVDHIFSQTNLKRIYLKTLSSNIRAQKCFCKCGFTTYGHSARDGFSFMLMEIYRDQWQKEPDET